MAAAADPLPSQPSEFRVVWVAFVSSAKPLLGPVPDDRPLDQFLGVRDKTLAIVLDDKFISELGSHLIGQTRDTRQSNLPGANMREQLFDALLEEMRACTRAAEVISATTSADSAEGASEAKKAQLSRFSTTLGSLKDVLEATPWLKAGVGLFKELVDYFR